MRRWLVPTAIVAAAVGLTACQRTEEKTEKTVVQPVPVPVPAPAPTPGPPGPPGAPGPEGAPGKSGATVVVPPVEEKKAEEKK